MAKEPQKITPQWLSKLTFRVLRAPVREISAPGGKDRQSLRLHLADGRRVIATKRPDPLRAENEAAFLTGLNRLGAPVPKVLGFEDGVMFQEDAGRNRVSYALVNAPGSAERVAIATAAVGALEAIRSAVENVPELMAKLPALGSGDNWRSSFVGRSFFLSYGLKITPPKVDTSALEAALTSDAKHFVRWDARAGNAAVQKDGSVLWYDWEVFGRREGVEDIAWLMADDFWTLTQSETESVLAGAAGFADPARRAQAIRMAVLIAANRLQLVAATVRAKGWAQEDAALRHDRIAATPEVLDRVVRNGMVWAGQDPLLAGFIPWFPRALAAVKAL